MMELHCLIKKEGHLYSAICLEFDVASQGKTHQEAEKNIKEAIELYLDGVAECSKGEIKHFLKRKAPYRYWQEYYKLYYQQAPQQLFKEVTKSRHPKINLEPVYK